MTDLPDTNDFYRWRKLLEGQGVLTQLLLEYYDENVYEATVDGETYRYPIGTHERLLYPHFTEEGVSAWAFESTDVNQPDEDTIERIAHQIAVAGGETIEDVDDVTEYIWDNPTFATTQAEFDTPDSSVKFPITKTSFYNVAVNGQELTEELMEAILEDHFVDSQKIDSEDVLSHDLPIRDRYFSSVLDRLQNLSERQQGIGGTYLTLLKGDDEYYIISGKRSSDVYIWPDYYTIFPAGFMQPNDVSTGSMIKDHLLTEYAEEFFGYETPTNSSRAVKSLSQLLESGDATFEVTGSGIDLTYGHTQITGLLIIDYEDYLEFVEDHSRSDFQHDKISLLGLSDLKENVHEFIHPHQMTPPAAFAVLNGLQYLENETDIEVPIDIDVPQQMDEHPPRLED